MATSAPAPSPIADPASTFTVVNAEGVTDLIGMSDAVDLVSTAMMAFSSGRMLSPERWAMSVGGDRLMALMPGAVPETDRYGVKVLTLGGSRGRSHQGVMVLFDGAGGRPICAIDASALTGLRTAAATIMATRALARPGARVLALLGCGEQAAWHMRGMALMGDLQEVRVWARSSHKAAEFAARYRRVGLSVVATASAEAAVRGADIVCTLTTSSEPVLKGEWLATGQHINLVGASTRSAREADDAVVIRSQFFVDSRDHALSQAGELRHSIESGLVGPEHVAGEIGQVLDGTVSGRTSADEITVYKSLGHVAQDLVVAGAIHARAGLSSAVVQVDWSGVAA